MIFSSNVTEVGLGLENKIIQINFSLKKCFDKKTNERNIHNRLHLNTEATRKKNGFTFLRIKIMLNPSYNGVVQRVQATGEERLVLIVS